MRPTAAFVLTCRFGTVPLDARYWRPAVAEAALYAARHGVAVFVFEAGGCGAEVAFCPPTLQCEGVVPYLFDGGLGAPVLPHLSN